MGGIGGVSQKFNQSATKVNSIDNDKLYALYSEAEKICKNAYNFDMDDTIDDIGDISDDFEDDDDDDDAPDNDTCICLTEDLEEDLDEYNFLYDLVTLFNYLGEVTKFKIFRFQTNYW